MQEAISRLSVEGFMQSLLSSSEELGPHLTDFQGDVPDIIRQKLKTTKFRGGRKANTYVTMCKIIDAALHAHKTEKKEERSETDGKGEDTDNREKRSNTWLVRVTGNIPDVDEKPSEYLELPSVKDRGQKIDISIYRADDATRNAVRVAKTGGSVAADQWKARTRWQLVRLFVEVKTSGSPFWVDSLREDKQCEDETVPPRSKSENYPSEGSPGTFSTHASSTSQSLYRASSSLHRNTGQIAEYAGTIRLYQHRIHILSVYIHKDEACFLLWDAAGVVLSDPFEFTLDPYPLYRFFYVVGQMTDTQLGWDPTVKLAEKDDEALWKTCEGLLLNNTKRQQDLRKRVSDAFSDPLCRFRVEVNGDDLDIARRRWDAVHPKSKSSNAGPAAELYAPSGTRTLLIGHVNAGHHSAFGRGTKGYIALDIQIRQFVFLKDCWRADFVGLDDPPEPEIIIYTRLREKVRHIPTILYGGDVYYTLATEDRPPPPPDRPLLERSRNHRNPMLKSVRPRIHTRIVMAEIGAPLDTYYNSLELIKVLRDALEAHREAYETSHILHHDISDGNIIIWHGEDGKPVGLLCDWDLSKPTDKLGKVVTQKDRSGTWIFLSGPCVALPRKPYALSDDLDSIVQLLKWLYLRWHAHNLRGETRRDKFETYIHSTFYRIIDDDGYWTGSFDKLGNTLIGWLLPDLALEEDKVTSKAFLDLLNDLAQLCREHYERYDWNAMRRNFGVSKPTTVIDSDSLLQSALKPRVPTTGSLDSHEGMLKLLDKALEREDWVQDKSDRSGTDNFAMFKHITEDPLAHYSSAVTSPSVKRSSAADSPQARSSKV